MSKLSSHVTHLKTLEAVDIRQVFVENKKNEPKYERRGNYRNCLKYSYYSAPYHTNLYSTKLPHIPYKRTVKQFRRRQIIVCVLFFFYFY